MNELDLCDKVVSMLNNFMEDHFEDLYDLCDKKEDLVEQYGFCYDNKGTIFTLTCDDMITLKENAFQIKEMVEQYGIQRTIEKLWIE